MSEDVTLLHKPAAEVSAEALERAEEMIEREEGVQNKLSGWLAAFIYVAGAALRLARFNANLGTVDKRYFQGMPSPAAASLVAGLIWKRHRGRAARAAGETGHRPRPDPSGRGGRRR